MTRYEVAPGFCLNVERFGDGPPLVLLHGFTGSARSWGAFGEALSAHFTLVALDIVGHGESDSPESLDHYRMDRVVDDLVRVVKCAGFERAHWLGYSMGGRTALQVAALRPVMVDRLVVIGGSAGIADAQGRADRVASDEALAARIERDGLPAFVDYWERIPLFASQERLPAEVRIAVRKGRLSGNVTGLANSLRGMGTGAQSALHDQLASLDIPTLLIAGEEDPKYTVLATELAAMMPEAAVALIPGAGHAAQLEAPGAVAHVVTAFLQDPRGA